jgi:hypothetical protein
MTLRQQIIDGLADAVAKELGIAKAEAFLRQTHSLITGESLFTLDDAALVDGGQDKQIDILDIVQEQDSATIFVIQGKSGDSFSSNELVSLHNGLRWIFERPKPEVESLSNLKLRDKILEYRMVQRERGPSNLKVVVVHATNGLSATLSDEYKQEQRAIIARFNNGTFQSFDFQPMGADELVELLNAVEKRERKIDEDIKIIYDTNNPSLIKYHASGLKGVVCTTVAEEIARLVNSDAYGHVFDANVRRFLGTRGAVNADILATCSDPISAAQFWFLNNGITIICDRFDPNTDPDDPHIKVEGMQIVNGCQTASALALAARSGGLSPGARVLLRIYETNSPALVDRIVLTTNNQNRISSRDLHANDPIQLDMERRFSDFGYYYERKNRQYEGKGLRPTQIMPNEQVAQSFLAVVLRKPSDARTRKYKVWSDLYDQVFSNRAVEQYILATLIVRAVSRHMRSAGLVSQADEVRRKLANNATFHIARVAAHLWLGAAAWDRKTEDKVALIKSIEEDPHIIDSQIRDGFEVIARLIKSQPAHSNDADAALKSASLDDDLNKTLYTGRLTEVR